MCVCVGSVFERDKLKEIHTMAAHCVNFKWHNVWVGNIKRERERKNAKWWHTTSDNDGNKHGFIATTTTKKSKKIADKE